MMEPVTGRPVAFAPFSGDCSALSGKPILIIFYQEGRLLSSNFSEKHQLCFIEIADCG
jgi:hypothetical protein